MLKVLSINTDWTTRLPLAKGAKLSQAVKTTVLAAGDVSFVVLQEIGPRNAKAVASAVGFAHVSRKIDQYSCGVIIYDEKLWKVKAADVEASTRPSYLRLRLKNRETDERVSVFTAHLPYKHRRTLRSTVHADFAAVVTQEFRREACDVVCCAGDLNDKPSHLEQIYYDNDCRLAFDDNRSEWFTTNAGCKDNAVRPYAQRDFSSKMVLHEELAWSHKPICVQA